MIFFFFVLTTFSNDYFRSLALPDDDSLVLVGTVHLHAVVAPRDGSDSDTVATEAAVHPSGIGVPHENIAIVAARDDERAVRAE